MLDIIFDIDQTLIESEYANSITATGKHFTINYRPTTRTLRRSSSKQSILTKIKSVRCTNQRTKCSRLRIFIRPYAKELLEWCFKYHRVSIWTAGTYNYAVNILVKLLTPIQFRKLHMILVRNPLKNTFIDIKTNTNFKIYDHNNILVKNMKELFENPSFKIYNFDKTKTVLIDDLARNLQINKKVGTQYNIYNIKAWIHTDLHDMELQKLQQLLANKIDS